MAEQPFQVIVDGEVVYKSDFEASTVRKVHIAGGSEGAELGSLPGQDTVIVTFDRMNVEVSNFLGAGEAAALREQADKVEKLERSRVSEGRAEQAKIDAAEKKLARDRAEATELAGPSQTIGLGQPSLSDIVAMDAQPESEKAKTPAASTKK